MKSLRYAQSKVI